MRDTIIAGNWKMNNTVPESLKLLASIEHHVKKELPGIDIVVIPPFTSLYSVGISLQGSFIKMGAQNLFWENNGAYTGEVAGPFLKDIGCKYVLVGHSERRKYFGDTGETVNKKTLAALRNDLIPIICVGESLEERERKAHKDVVERQVKEALFGFHLRDVENVVVAYEPVWAIGTGKTASPEEAQEMHYFIRNLMEKVFDSPTANKIRILYGGSVTAKIAQDLLGQKDIDGALVGGASLKGEEFGNIVAAASLRQL